MVNFFVKKNTNYTLTVSKASYITHTETINVSGDDATGIFARKSDNGTEVSSVVINGKSLTVNANVKQEDVIKAMGKKEYELWLDELFRLSLTLIVLVDYTSKRKDINELKAKLG